MHSRDNHAALLDLTDAQKQIWYTEEMYPGTSIYNLGGTVIFKGMIHPGYLQKSILHFLQSHEGVRYQFCKEGNLPKQYEASNALLPPSFVNFSEKKNPELAFKDWTEEQAAKPFSLVDSPLFEFYVLQLNEQQWGYFVKLHHLIADGWSMEIMTASICSEYNRLSNGMPASEVNTLSASYAEYLREEQKYLASGRFLKDMEYWQGVMENLPEPMIRQPASGAFNGKRHITVLKGDLVTQLRQFINTHEFTLNDVIQAACVILISKYYQCSELLVNMPVMNRVGRRHKQSFSMCTKIMPFRIKVCNQQAVFEFIRHCRSIYQKGLIHRKFPQDELVKLSNKERDGLPIFQCAINCYSTSLVNQIAGINIENHEFHSGQQLLPLQFIAKEWNDRDTITLEIDYWTSIFNESIIENMALSLRALLRDIIANAGRSIGEIGVLDESQRQKILYAYNDTAVHSPPDTVISLFEKQAERTPSRIAVIDQEERLSYAELNLNANKLLEHLLNSAQSTYPIVALVLPRSAECIVAMLAVLKAKGTYIPIEPETPSERIKFILEDAGAQYCIVSDPAVLPPGDFGYETTVGSLELWRCGGGAGIAHINNSEPLAYILYTSGTSGQPKGVAVSEGALAHYVRFAQETYVQEAEPVFPLYSSLAFDLTITSIFTPLICGGTIKVFRGGDSGAALLEAWRDGDFSIIKLTPSHLSVIEDLPLHDRIERSLKIMVVGGEDLRAGLACRIVNKFRRSLSIYNEYGPTEATVGCMIHKFNPELDIGLSVPIGRPISNMQVYVLDSAQNLLPFGAEGEICVAGAGLAEGYMNRQELTAEKFIAHPFHEGSRLYRTGDVGRLLPEMIMEYGGRIDEQVKIRGYRIELGEIEGLLNSLDGIEASVATVVQHGDTKHIYAYVVKDGAVTDEFLFSAMEAHLPQYMIPSGFVTVEALPINANGKIDKSKLPPPSFKIRQIDKPTDYGGAQGDILEEIRRLFHNSEIGFSDHFFKLGGDSIKALQLSSRLYEKEIYLKVTDILTFPHLDDMVGKAVALQAAPLQPPLKGYIHQTPSISWFFSQPLLDKNYYFHTLALELKNRPAAALNRVFRRLIIHHDELRMNYDPVRKQLFYNELHLQRDKWVDMVDMSSELGSRQIEKITEYVDECMSRVSITEDLLFQAIAFQLSPDTTRIVIFAHHLVVDGVSWRILLDDLQSLLSHESKRLVDARSMPPRTDSYSRWSELLQNYRCTQEENDYWMDIVDQLNASHPWLLTHKQPISQDTYRSLTLIMDEETTERLIHAVPAALSIEPQAVFMAILGEEMGQRTNYADLWLMLENHGRHEITGDMNVARTVGWFTGMYPMMLRTCMEGETAIIDTQKRLNAVPRHGTGYGAGKFSPQRHPAILFNYLGEISANYNDFLIIEGSFGKKTGRNNAPTVNLEINIMVMERKLQIELITYGIPDAEQLAANYKERLLALAAQYSSVEMAPGHELFETAGLPGEDLDYLFK
ncbi:amino acid adenylation domain-containing protein [Paenibacillus sp. FSL R7-0204]|uniref:amino acid adenylation domain-containing protein n=1 Tax=Paenibacillus sp. FSL R7-0204 TaxID=2921675 RepID=UPI0030FB5B3F